MNIKAIFVVMNTTSALAKIENCTGIKGHGFKSRTGLNFFRPYFLIFLIFPYFQVMFITA